MIRDDSERIVERYASGRMTPAEQEEMLSRAASDEKLGRLLDAEQSVMRAISRDRAVLPVMSTQPPPGLLSSLSASSAGGGGVAMVAGAKLGQIVAAVVGTLGVVAAVYFGAPLFTDDEPAGHDRRETIQKMVAPVKSRVEQQNAPELIPNEVSTPPAGRAEPSRGAGVQRQEGEVLRGEKRDGVQRDIRMSRKRGSNSEEENKGMAPVVQPSKSDPPTIEDRNVRIEGKVEEGKK